MVPQHWPKNFIYSPESVTFEFSPVFLRLFLSTVNPEDLEKISPVIEKKSIHPDIKLKTITKNLKYSGIKPHPLASRKSLSGHTHRGVFASKNISQGTELGEYVGEMHIMSIEEFSRVDAHKYFLSEYTWRIEHRDFFVFVNASKIANEMAFINDYHGLQSQPNVRGKWAVHRGSFYFVYETCTDVKAGDELLTDYFNPLLLNY